ncbi:DUF6233 domain-containing protein [Streptomyces sp. NPDC056831]|uniref:DUF6233 domain-containing protein n=1 Tax=Streptomyces sp. NPDC056831 TaxID=3345954 RepID=UPI0036BDA579
MHCGVPEGDRRSDQGGRAAGGREPAGRGAPPAPTGLGARTGHRCWITPHRGPCRSLLRPFGRSTRAITREQAVAALIGGVRACLHCRPDTDLRVLD